MPLPRQNPENDTRATCSAPATSTPMLDRRGWEWCARTPPCTRMPVGTPSAHVKRSPLMPTDVASAATRRCIDDTVSRRTTVEFESTGCSA